MSRCPSCGTDGVDNSMGRFVSDDWMRCQTLQSKINLLEGQLKEEQKDCQLQRKNKTAQWERAEKLERVIRVVTNNIRNSDMDSQFKKTLLELVTHE